MLKRHRKNESGAGQALRASPDGQVPMAPAAFKTLLAAQRKIVKETEVSLAAEDTAAAAGKVSGLALSLGGQVETSENAEGKTLVLKSARGQL